MIYGPNGSGKTTLLKILAGYLKPWRGRIYRDADMMYIPQNISLFYTEESVKKEVQEICRTRGLGERCAKDLLKKIVDIGIDINLSPFDLSYGQQVKLAIEISRNVSDNIILLIDEPFSGLTYVDRIEILKDLLSDDKTKIIATANLDIISRYRSHTKIYMLREGSLYKYIYSEADENIDLEFLKSLYRGSL
jgi:energy-coupling factor transport system ATP-binding protein